MSVIHSHTVCELAPPRYMRFRMICSHSCSARTIDPRFWEGTIGVSERERERYEMGSEDLDIHLFIVRLIGSISQRELSIGLGLSVSKALLPEIVVRRYVGDRMSLRHELVLGVSASRIWAALKDAKDILPKIAPHFMASIDIIQGTHGQVGSVSLIKFGSALPEGAYVKERLVSINQETKTLVTEEIEGGHLAAGFTKWQSTVSFFAEGADKVRVLSTLDYSGGGDAAETILEQAKGGFDQLFHGLEAYLLSSGAYA